MNDPILYLFLQTRPSTQKIFCPPGFHTEITDHGQLAWKLDATPKAIEDSLIFIGRHLS